LSPLYCSEFIIGSNSLATKSTILMLILPKAPPEKEEFSGPEDIVEWIKYLTELILFLGNISNEEVKFMVKSGTKPKGVKFLGHLFHRLGGSLMGVQWGAQLFVYHPRWGKYERVTPQSTKEDKDRNIKIFKRNIESYQIDIYPLIGIDDRLIPESIKENLVRQKKENGFIWYPQLWAYFLSNEFGKSNPEKREVFFKVKEKIVYSHKKILEYLDQFIKYLDSEDFQQVETSA